MRFEMWSCDGYEAEDKWGLKRFAEFISKHRVERNDNELVAQYLCKFTEEGDEIEATANQYKKFQQFLDDAFADARENADYENDCRNENRPYSNGQNRY